MLHTLLEVSLNEHAKHASCIFNKRGSSASKGGGGPSDGHGSAKQFHNLTVAKIVGRLHARLVALLLCEPSVIASGTFGPGQLQGKNINNGHKLVLSNEVDTGHELVLSNKVDTRHASLSACKGSGTHNERPFGPIDNCYKISFYKDVDQ